MFEWINTNFVSFEMRNHIDYALFSYYEDDCNNIVYDTTYWSDVFTELGNIFPNSALGFGEVGTAFKLKKKASVQRYYSLNIAHERFIGGYFWWYFWQDRNSFPPDWIKEVWPQENEQ